MGHELVLCRGNAIVGTTLIHGTITVVSADNPASCSVGGFKEGASAYRFCRHCLMTMHQINTKVRIQTVSLSPAHTDLLLHNVLLVII